MSFLLKDIKFIVFLNILVFAFYGAAEDPPLTNSLLQQTEGTGGTEGTGVDNPRVVPPGTQTIAREQQSVFMKKLSASFTKSEMAGLERIYTIFDPGKNASQSFKKECLNQYGDFSNGITAYYRHFNQASGGHTQIEPSIRMSISNCGQNIYTVYSRLNKNLALASANYRKSLGDLKIIFKNPPSSQEVEGVRHLIELFTKSVEFDSSCKTVFDRYLAGDISSVSVNNDEIGSLLEELHNRGCYEKRIYLDKLVNDPLFKDFIDKPNQCGVSAQKCVYELRQAVGLERSNENNPFPCSEDLNQTSECCISPGECKYSSKARDEYKAILKSAGGSSGEEGICHTEDERAKISVRKKFEKKTQEICKESADKCQKCQKLAEFREDFLNCFFLPNFDSYRKLHSNNKCNQQIVDIENKFNQTAKHWFKEQVGISLKAILDESSPVGDVVSSSCQKHYVDLNKDKRELMARSEGVFQDVCSDVAEEEEEEEEKNKVASSARDLARAAREYRRSQRGGSGETVYNTHSGPGNVGAASDSAIFSNGQFAASGNRSGGASFNNLDPKYFPKKGNGKDDSSDGTEELFGSNDVDYEDDKEYKGPPDPFASLSEKTSDTEGVGNLADLKDEILGSEASSGEGSGKRASSEFALMRHPAGVGGDFGEDAYMDSGQGDDYGGFFSRAKKAF